MPTDTTQKPSASNWGSSRSSDRRRKAARRSSTQALEHGAEAWLSDHLSGVVRVPVVLLTKFLWAGLFPVLLLLAIVATGLWWPEGAGLARYDALVIYALAVQVLFLALRLETRGEAALIFLFHLLGTAMELYKTDLGAWNYPEPGMLKLAAVPLFSGFMYAAVGSFLTRAIRVFHLRFERFPPLWAVLPLVVAIYANFFTHHVLPDMRWILFVASVALFRKTRMVFRTDRRDRRMPLPFAAICLSVPLWIAETIGTLTGTWAYADHMPRSLAPISTLGSWYLLLYVSFMLVLAGQRQIVERGELRWK